MKKAGFVGESPFPLGFSAKLDLAKPIVKYWTLSLPIEISLAWNRTIKANGRRLGISSPTGRLGTKGTRRGCKSLTHGLKIKSMSWVGIEIQSMGCAAVE